MRKLTEWFIAAWAIAMIATPSNLGAGPACAATAAPAAPGIYGFTLESIDGRPVKLSSYKGKVLIIVNTASFCGHTPQYASLEALYEKYKGDGLRILAFPANDFNHQEPGDNATIREFCTSKYHVSFDLFSKIDVIGPNQAALYKFLTDPSTDPQFAGPIRWNFTKFLISRDGTIVGRIEPEQDPKTPQAVAAIEQQLAARA